MQSHLSLQHVFPVPFSELSFCLVGIGKSTLSCFHLLKSQGVKKIGFYEPQTFTPSSQPDFQKILLSENPPFLHGPLDEKTLNLFLEDFDICVVSPGIPLHTPYLLNLRKKEIPVVSEIEVGVWFLPSHCHVVGITGTNGKSTTTHYTAQLLTRYNRDAIACGNIGYPFTQALLDNPLAKVFVIELSSYQLESTYSLKVDVSLFLNLTPDHLQRYKIMSEYLKSKWRLILLTREKGLALIEKDVFLAGVNQGLSLPNSCAIQVLEILEKPSAEMVKKSDCPENTKPLCHSEIFYNPLLPQPTYESLSSTSLHSLCPGLTTISYWNEKVDIPMIYSRSHPYQKSKDFNGSLSLQEPCLPGIQNVQNISFASFAALHLGVSLDQVKEQWERSSTTYSHLPHRLEEIPFHMLKPEIQKKNVRFINDSKATNVESTVIGLKSFPHSRILLLLGGLPKGESYAPLALFPQVKKYYFFGKAGPDIEKELRSLLNECDKISTSVPSLRDALTCAFDEADEHDVILLSPACASLDEFKNFEERGNIFKAWASHSNPNIP